MLDSPLFSFIGGVAGTGKSYYLSQLHKKNPNSTALCATTGIAAVNLGAGITINALLWYYDTPSLLDSWTMGKLDWRLNEVYNHLGIRRILLDEASMLEASHLSILCLAIDGLNEALYRNGKEQLGLTLCGDFCQLPPIEGDFAFESEHWEKFEANTKIFHEVYRQEDKEFIQGLQWVREGNGRKAAEYFEDRMFRLLDPEYDGATVYPYNSQVDRQNKYRLESVEGEKVSFPTRREGRQRTEWEKHIPEVITAKIGALVMLLANKYEGGEIEYCNGDLGTIMSVEYGRPWVKLQRNGKLVKVEEVIRANHEIIDGEKKQIGKITYIPIRLAYASTVHKSQGLTFDKIQVDFRSKFFAETPGMLYVALSRCRTKEGLRLMGSPKTFIQNCKVNSKVERFL